MNGVCVSVGTGEIFELDAHAPRLHQSGWPEIAYFHFLLAFLIILIVNSIDISFPRTATNPPLPLRASQYLPTIPSHNTLPQYLPTIPALIRNLSKTRGK